MDSTAPRTSMSERDKQERSTGYPEPTDNEQRDIVELDESQQPDNITTSHSGPIEDEKSSRNQEVEREHQRHSGCTDDDAITFTTATSSHSVSATRSFRYMAPYLRESPSFSTTASGNWPLDYSQELPEYSAPYNNHYASLSSVNSTTWLRRRASWPASPGSPLRTVGLRGAPRASSGDIDVSEAGNSNDQRWKRLSCMIEKNHDPISAESGRASRLGLSAEKGANRSGPASAEDQVVYPGPFALTWIIVAICLSVFIISLDRNIIATAIPNITARFKSSNDIGWYGSAYLLTASACQPLYGRVYMHFEIKSSFLIALLIFEIGSLVAATCPTSEVLILGRAIQGIGSAGIVTGSFVIGTHSVRLQFRPILFAAVGMLFGIGALTGPLLGGVFTDTIGWRWCFYINLPLGAVTFLAIFFCFNKFKCEHTRSFIQRVLQLDLIGNLILSMSLTMLFLALQFAQERYPWSSARCVGLLCGFGVTIIIFIAWMVYRGEEALIPPRIMRQRSVGVSCAAAFLIYGAILLHSYYLPIWFQAVKGVSALRSGANMVPYMVMTAVFTLLAGIFVSKTGYFAPPAILGCPIGVAGSALLASLLPSTPVAVWAAYESLVAAGLGLAIQQGFTAVQAMLPLHDVPIGTAVIAASQSLGGAVFVSVGNTILQTRLAEESAANSMPGVNLTAVFELGATKFRALVPPEDLPSLIALYNSCLQDVFIAAIPLCALAFLCNLGLEWKNLKSPNGLPSRERRTLSV